MLHSYLTSYRIPALTVRLSAVVYGGAMNDNSLFYLEQGKKIDIFACKYSANADGGKHLVIIVHEVCGTRYQFY